MRRYLHGGVNITGFQLLDPDNKRFQDFMDIWDSLDKYNYPGAGTGRFNVSNVLYPYLTNGLSHHNHLGESTFILGALGVILNFYLILR